METAETAAAPVLAKRPDNVPADRVLDFNLHRPMPAGQTVHEFWRYAMAGAAHDVMWTPHSGGHWIVMDPDLCEIVLTDPERFSSRVVIVPRDPAGKPIRNTSRSRLIRRIMARSVNFSTPGSAPK